MPAKYTTPLQYTTKILRNVLLPAHSRAVQNTKKILGGMGEITVSYINTDEIDVEVSELLRDILRPHIINKYGKPESWGVDWSGTSIEDKKKIYEAMVRRFLKERMIPQALEIIRERYGLKNSYKAKNKPSSKFGRPVSKSSSGFSRWFYGLLTGRKKSSGKNSVMDSYKVVLYPLFARITPIVSWFTHPKIIVDQVTYVVKDKKDFFAVEDLVYVRELIGELLAEAIMSLVDAEIEKRDKLKRVVEKMSGNGKKNPLSEVIDNKEKERLMLSGSGSIGDQSIGKAVTILARLITDLTFGDTY